MRDDVYASFGVKPRTRSKLAVSSPIFDPFSGLKSTRIVARIFSSRMLRKMPSRSLPGSPAT